MLKISVVAVGHRPPDWVEAGYAEYAKRLQHDVKLDLIELKPSRSSERNVVLVEERERLVKALPRGAHTIVLDETGAAWTTRQLAQRLETARDTGQALTFVIGGAEGLHSDIKATAATLLSLSALTLPHALVRVLLVEQLYRAISLLKNHPYHRE